MEVTVPVWKLTSSHSYPPIEPSRQIFDGEFVYEDVREATRRPPPKVEWEIG